MTAARAALGWSLFVYLTCELFPIGAQDPIVADLHSTPAAVGQLVTAYAVVAGIVTVPAVRLASRFPPRTGLALSMLLLGAAQVVSAAAPNLLLLGAARAVAALGHGLVWSQAPVVAASLARPEDEGRATAAVFVGSSLALILGAPLSSAAAGAVGWRTASVGLAAGAVLAAGLLRATLPSRADLGERTPQRDQQVSWGPVLVVCATTLVVVVGHYVSYDYFAPIAHHVGVGTGGVPLLLAGYGVLGLLGVVVVGHLLDGRARLGGVCVVGLLTLALALLAAPLPTPWAVVAFLAWGAAAAALPPVLNTAVLRATTAGRETASGAYVVAYQIGIAAGAGLGGLLLARQGIGALPAWSAGLALVALVVVAGRKEFGRR